MADLWEKNRFRPSTRPIDEAMRRGTPVMRLDEGSLVQSGSGFNHKRIKATIAGTTSSIAVELAGDKKATGKSTGTRAEGRNCIWKRISKRVKSP